MRFLLRVGRWLAATAALPLFSGVLLGAQTLTMTIEVTNITYRYDPPHDFGGGSFPAVVTHELQFAPVTLTNVNLTNYSTFALRVSAPAGQIFFARGSNYESSLDITAMAAPGGIVFEGVKELSLSFEQLEGQPPTPLTTQGVLNPTSIHFDATESFSSPTKFHAMVYSFSPDTNKTNITSTFQITPGLLPTFQYVIPTAQWGDLASTQPFLFLVSTDAVPPVRIEKTVGISWVSAVSDTLQPEWTDDLNSNAVWKPLGPVIEVHPGTNRVFDLADPPHRFYRLSRPK